MLRLVLVTAVLPTLACTSATPSHPASASGSGSQGGSVTTSDDPAPATPVLSFSDTAAGGSGEDFSTTQSGPLIAGGNVTVEYDLARISTCQATSNGFAVWGVTGYAQFDDGTIVTLTLSQLQGANVIPVAATLALPASATSVALWFAESNEWGCIAYDSNYSQNYTFALQPSGAAAVIDFPTSLSQAPTQSAAIAAGDQVVVHYEPDRLSQCYALSNEAPAWSVTMFWQVDAGAVQSTPASLVEGDALVAADPTITIPQGSALALWFEATSSYGCVAWDSQYGANYQFTIQ
jgi:hypothetical protein